MKVIRGKVDTSKEQWVPGQVVTLSGGKRTIAVWHSSKYKKVQIEAVNGEGLHPGEEPRETSIFLSEEALRAIFTCCRRLGISLREKEPQS